MGKKSTVSAAPKISAASSPAVSSGPTTTQKSSILKSSFAPSHFQLRLFASVIQSLESQLLRIHDTTTGRLRCNHGVRPGVTVTSLDWGYYGTSYREGLSKKKRKRSHNNAEHAVVALGTSNSEVLMFSPSEGKVIGQLVGGHDSEIRDFKFSHEEPLEGWSIGADSKLVQWDLKTDRPIRTVTLPDPSISILTPPHTTAPHLICASSTPFAIDLHSKDDARIEPFDSLKNPIHTLYRSHSLESVEQYLLAADRERYINIYNIDEKCLVRTLVAGSGVESADFSIPLVGESQLDQQILAVVTKDGIVELFPKPFQQSANNNGDLRSSRKNLTKKSSAQVRLKNSDQKLQNVSVFAATLQGPDLVMASAEGGIDVHFQKVRWQDEGSGELLFNGVKEVLSTRTTSSLNNVAMNGVKDMSKSNVDESRTVVVNGGDESATSAAVIDISSSDEDENEEEEESEDEDDKNETDQAMIETTQQDSDEEMLDIEDNQETEDKDLQTAEDAVEQAEPSFGELLASKHETEIAIADAIPPEQSAFASALTSGGHLSLSSGMSLGTVLTQSLRTNDRNLLEACLHTTDISIVRNTIQRLDSTLAGTLLSKLAERLASRPGRYGHLLTWVQWTCVAHGGAIASQPAVIAKLKTLYKVLDQRSRSMDNLLLLKGKLDMLDAQLTFRKQFQAQREAQRSDKNEPGMIYIEGEKDNWSSSDEDVDNLPTTSSTKRKSSIQKKRRKALEDLLSEASSESGDDEAMPLVNGLSGSSDSEEDEEDDEDALPEKRPGGLYDEEADVSGEEEAGSSDEEGDDIGLSDEEIDEEEEEEEDSEMDSFINDGSISEVSEENEIDVDDEEEEDNTPKKPAKKKSKFA